MSSRIWRAGLGFVLCLLWGSVRSTESGSPPEGPIHLVHDFFPDESEGEVPPSQLTKLANTLFFVGTDVETGQTVWRTDGTPSGSRQVPLVGHDGAVSNPVIAGRLGSRVLWITGADSGGVLWAATEQGDGIALRTYHPNGSEHIPFEIVGGRLFFQDCTDTACAILSTDGTAEGTGPVPALAARFTAVDQELVGAFADRWLVFRSRRALFAYDMPRNRVLPLVPDGVQFVQAYPAGDSLFLLTNYNQLWISRLTSPRASLLFSRPGLAVAGWRGSTLYFVSEQGNLWSTEGRPQTTRFYSGLGVERFSVLADQLGAIGSTTFLPMPGYYSAGLLGVDESKRKVREILHVCTGKYPCLASYMSPVTVAGKLAFEDINGLLWQSDGTSKGTKVHDVLTAPNPFSFRVFDGRLVLGASNMQGEQQLWETDGTVSGTRALSDGTLEEPFQVQGPPESFGGALFVAARRKPAGSQLWRIANGQATPVTDFRHLGKGIYPFSAFSVGDRLVIGGGGDSLGWIGLAADGTAEPLPVSEESCIFFPSFNGPCPFKPVVTGQRLVFAQNFATEELWSTDGTLTGTGRLELQNGDTSLSSLAALGKLGDLALVLDIGGGLWTTDGTGGARFITQLATDPNQIFQVRGVGPPVSLGPQTFLFRRVPDSDDPSVADLELWRTDGTAAGTLRLASIPFDKDGTPYPNPTIVSGRFFFRFLGTLWKSDGTLEGTQPLPNQLPGGTFGLAAGAGILYAAAGQFDLGNQTLWAIDPATLAATQLGVFHQIAGGGPGVSLGGVVNGVLLFQVADEQDATRWWSTEGTPASTHPVPEPFGSDTGVDPFTAGDRRAFTACDDDHGCELWSVDRLGEDLRLVEDLWPGAQGSNPEILAVTGNALLLAATEPNAGRELWKLDLSSIAAASSTRAKANSPSRPILSPSPAPGGRDRSRHRLKRWI